jgi:hypothetical protein
MTNEIANDTNNNHTVEQNQHTAARAAIPSATPEPSAPVPEPIAGAERIAHNSPTRTTLQATITLNRHRGRIPKIAQLPPELIAFVNEELLRNTPLTIIVQALEEKGYPGFNHKNIGNWKMGGFKSWVAQQQSIEYQLRQRQMALDYASKHGCSLLDTLAQLNAHNLYEAAIAVNPSKLGKKLEDDPALFLKLNHEIGSFLKIMEGIGRNKFPGKKMEENPAPANDEEADTGLTQEQRDDVDRRFGILQEPPLQTVYTPTAQPT